YWTCKLVEEATMSQQSTLRNLSLFQGCTDAQVARAAQLLTTIDASPGRHLMVQGDTARQFVIIETGMVQVTHHVEDGPNLVVYLGADSYVGEVGLLDGVPCTATVVTAGDGAR